jgi:hypothetical protein
MSKIEVLVLASALLLGTTALPAAARVNLAVDIGVPPPAPYYEAVPEARTGYDWAPGYWRWEGGEHVWVRGRWMEGRPGYAYVPERWEVRGGRHHFEPGRWERR